MGQNGLFCDFESAWHLFCRVDASFAEVYSENPVAAATGWPLNAIRP
jgi:hypothetical protein